MSNYILNHLLLSSLQYRDGGGPYTYSEWNPKLNNKAAIWKVNCGVSLATLSEPHLPPGHLGRGPLHYRHPGCDWSGPPVTDVPQVSPCVSCPGNLPEAADASRRNVPNSPTAGSQVRRLLDSQKKWPYFNRTHGGSDYYCYIFLSVFLALHSHLVLCMELSLLSVINVHLHNLYLTAVQYYLYPWHSPLGSHP